ncbi:hypothetical protein [Citromicrobium bathyomarinum]|uniref:hypothetical protein n=1 Tax=Citromicrobium bathyomarinum TaxID=72174 RepID=UPI00315A28FC
MKCSVLVAALAVGVAFAAPVAAEEADWEASEAMKPCFAGGSNAEELAAALKACRELLGSARYGGEDAAMIRYAIIDYQADSASTAEQIEQLASLSRDSLPEKFRYGRDERLARLCYNDKRWQCVIDAMRPDLESTYMAIDGLSMFREAMVETQGAAATETLGSELIQKRGTSAVGYLVRAEARTKSGDKAGAIADLVAAGERLPADNASGMNGVCWTLVTELAAAEKARTYCDKAAAESPLNWLIWDSHGAMNLALKRNANAWADYEQAVRLAPEAASALYGRGLALERLGRDADAEKDKQAAIAIDPDIAKTYKGYGI